MDLKARSDKLFWDLPCRGKVAAAFWCESGLEWDYDRLDEAVERVMGECGAFVGLGMLRAENSLHCLVHYLALLRAGKPFILVDARSPQTVIDELSVLFRPSYEVHFVSGQPVVQHNPDHEPYPIAPDLALLLTTSGSSGKPKLVMLSHDNLQANALSIAQYLNLTVEERAITSLSMAYSYGLSVINSHLLVGAGLILTERSLMERAFWQRCLELKATSLAGVPFQYELLEKLRFRRMDLPSLRTLTQAGGKLSDQLALTYSDWARETGRQFFLMYGQTEATARMSYLAAHRHPDKVPGIGQAIPGGELLLRDREGRLIEGAGQGELVYQGPNVMMGYAVEHTDLDRPERPQELCTGDLAQRDEEGYLRIVGRLSRFLKLQGRRIDLDGLQNRLREAGWDLWMTGDDQQLCAILRTGQDPAELEARLKTETGLHHSLFRVAELDEPVMTVSGKPDYRSMKAKVDAADN